MKTKVSKCFPLSVGSKGGHPEKEVQIAHVVRAIKSNKAIKALVENVRGAKDKKEKTLAKKKLPAITPAAIFNNKRKKDDVASFSGLTVLDFDHVPDVTKFKKQLAKVKYVFIAFVSPSGDGVKAIIRTPAVTDQDQHVGTFESLKEFFASDHLDDSGKDHTRLCFMSYDPDIYVNEDAEPWTQMITKKTSSSSVKVPRPDVEVEKREEVILGELRKIHPDFFEPIGSNRNNACMKRSAMFCDYGISEEVAKDIIGRAILDWDDFEVKEFEKAVSQGYKSGEFGSKTITKRPEIPAAGSFSRGTRRPTPEPEEIPEDTGSFSRGSARKKETAPAKTEKKEAPKKKSDPERLESIVDENNDPIFWYYVTSGKGKQKKTTLKIDVVDLLAWLAYFGYASTKVADEPKLVRIVDNVVEVVTPWDIKHFVINWLDELREIRPKDEKGEVDDVKRLFLSKSALSELKNLSGLPPVEIKKLKDNKTSSRLYFENCVAEITKDSVTRYEYADLDSLIWKAEINGRNLSEKKPKGKGHYEKFIENVSRLTEESADLNKQAFETTIGYLVHTYKNPSTSKIVLTNDSHISIEGASSGRSGKGLFGKSLGHIRSRYEMSGKTLKPDDKFWLQGVKPHHQIVNIEDVARKFSFESLYNLVTDDWTIEQKYQGAIQIPADEAPKIIASTNFTVSSLDPSTLDRVHNLEFSTHYHAGVRGLADHRPEDDFGCQLFYDWTGKRALQWDHFDHYIIHCLQQYLTHGLVKPKTKNLKRRQLINAVGMTVVDWLEDVIEEGKLITFDEKIANIAVHEQFTKWCLRNNIDRFDRDQRSFTGKMFRYFRDTGYDVKTDVKTHHNGNRVRGFIVSRTEAAEVELDPEQLPPESNVKI